MLIGMRQEEYTFTHTSEHNFTTTAIKNTITCVTYRGHTLF